MRDRFVVYGCSNEANLEAMISVHRIPFYNDERREAKRRRKRWVDFVKMTRDKWEPTINSAICSKHFTPESFQRRFVSLEGQTKPNVPRLVRDDFGICAFPTLRNESTEAVQETAISARERRAVRQFIIVCITFQAFVSISMSLITLRAPFSS